MEMSRPLMRNSCRTPPIVMYSREDTESGPSIFGVLGTTVHDQQRAAIIAPAEINAPVEIIAAAAIACLVSVFMIPSAYHDTIGKSVGNSYRIRRNGLSNAAQLEHRTVNIEPERTGCLFRGRVATPHRQQGTDAQKPLKCG